VNLASFARKIETLLAETPQAVDANVIGSSPEPRAQQETGENEPGLLVVSGPLTSSHTAFQSWPESTDEGGIPFALWYSQNRVPRRFSKLAEFDWARLSISPGEAAGINPE